MVKFPHDAHDIVMLVRTTVEFFIFILFVLLSPQISWLQNISQLQEVKIGVSAALFASLVFLCATLWRRLQDKPITIVTYFESLVDAVLIIWLIYIFGGMNGPFFFFFFLALMEAAFTFKMQVVLAVEAMGIIGLVGSYVYAGSVDATPTGIFILFFRIISVGLIGFYSHAFMQSVLKEKEASRRLQQSLSELQVLTDDLEKANERIRELNHMKDDFIPIATKELNAPLMAIKNYLWMLKEGKSGIGEGGSKGKIVDKIVKTTEELLNLLRDFDNRFGGK